MQEIQTTFGSWPAAFAIVASVVAIVTGLVNFLRRTDRSIEDIKQQSDISALDLKYTSVKEHLTVAKNEIVRLRDDLKYVQRHLKSHEDHAIRDFDRINKKIDKITDLIIELLNHEDEKGD